MTADHLDALLAERYGPPVREWARERTEDTLPNIARRRRELLEEHPDAGTAHGTEGGYYQHVKPRRGEPRTVPCAACCAAHATAARERRARRRTAA